MPFSLAYLIRASGYAGVAGQSFRNHVIGAATGAKMSDYIVSDWLFDSAPDPDFNYDDGATFAMPIAFTQGSRAHFIKRAGSGVLTVQATYGPDYGGTLPESNAGFQIDSTSHLIDAGATGALTVTLRAPMAPATGFAGSAWFDGYAHFDVPTYDGVNPDPVRFDGVIAGGGAGGTPVLQCFSVMYAPDIGPFSPMLFKTFPLMMIERATDESTSPYAWEWHTNSSYTDLHSSDASFLVNSRPMDSFTYYLRVRPLAGGAWNNVGAVTFDDPRLS
jgi:hypothetical protein